MKRAKGALLVLWILLFSSFAMANVINIPADQPTIQEGINVAIDGDTVLVHPGIYVENINYFKKNITVASLFLTTQDTTYKSLTIIDGNQNGSVVTIANGEDSRAILNGFTIRYGSAAKGGGIYCYESSPSLENVIIIDNSADYHGGGFFCWRNSSPTLKNVIISGNRAGYHGGGIFCWNNSNPTIENFIISGNTVNMDGAGIYCWDNSNPSFKNGNIKNNIADRDGGGIYCWFNSDPTLKNLNIYENIAKGNGGGIFCWNNSDPTLENFDIYKNTAKENGGGVYCWDSSNPSFINGNIKENIADRNGGGIYCWNDSNPSLVNCNLWNDLPQEIYFCENGEPNSISIVSSNIQEDVSGIIINNVEMVEGLNDKVTMSQEFEEIIDSKDFNRNQDLWDRYYGSRKIKFGLGGGRLFFIPHKRFKNYESDNGFFIQLNISGIINVGYSKVDLMLKEEIANSLGIDKRKATLDGMYISYYLPIPIFTPNENFLFAPMVIFGHKSNLYLEFETENLTKLEKYNTGGIFGIGFMSIIYKHINLFSSFEYHYLFPARWWYIFTFGIDGFIDSLNHDRIEAFTEFRVGINILF
ncbi:MAG: right-handed parallel beta-helix repeat-containing protein [Bacteroidetes bacterium]|nr:right-handed parallel beta-helix repeat-containing protein [Bacteroidota bacterium]